MKPIEFENWVASHAVFGHVELGIPFKESFRVGLRSALPEHLVLLADTFQRLSANLLANLLSQRKLLLLEHTHFIFRVEALVELLLQLKAFQVILRLD